MERHYKFETLQIHAGQSVDPATGARAVPIYQTTSYGFEDTEHAADLFALRRQGNIYTRIMNPTTDVFEQRMAALEGGVGALAVSSGSAAITYAILNLARSGDQVVSATSLYGGTYNLFRYTLARLGIEVRFVNSDNLEEFAEAITDRTRAIYAETIGNPGMNLIDMEKLSRLAADNRLPLIIDNTFATPYLFRPFEHGASIVVHSATKFIGGHGTSLGGVIVDGGNFDWQSSGRFPAMTEPDPSYHGICYPEAFGNQAYITKARVQLLRDTGACLSPFNAFLLLQGLETLSLRVDRHLENTRAVTEFLAGHDKVNWVNYPSLPGNKYNELASKYFPRGVGSIFTFEVAGGVEAGRRFIERLELFSHLANVADAKSLVIHPASTTHQQMTESEQRRAGITPGMIRLSIGLENAGDLIDDLRQALAAV